MYISPLGFAYESSNNALINSTEATTNVNGNEDDSSQPLVLSSTDFELESLGINRTGNVISHNESKGVIANQLYIHQFDTNRNKDFKLKDEPLNDEIVSGGRSSATYTYRNNNLNNKEIIGFVPYWSISSYQNIDYSKFSTLAYFSLTSDDTGAWVMDVGYNTFYSNTFTNFKNLAQSKNVKVVLVAKNFDPYSIRQIVTNSNSAGDRLINNIVRTIRDNGLDGVNVDFEYVSSTLSDSLRKSFADWHTKLADRVHSEFPKAHVSTDVFGGSGVYYNIYDMELLGKSSVDYIVMMTYDYITTSCYSGKIITPMSPLYGNSGFNISSHLIAGANKAGSKKIIMGIPYYGIDFRVKSADRELYNARVDYPNCSGVIETYGSIVDPKYDSTHNSNTMRWNSSEKARWYTYPYNGTYRHGYYDDARSLSAKYDFVQSQNLAGIGIWAVGYDRNAVELYNVIRDKFQKAPFYIQFKYGVSESSMSNIITKNNLNIVTNLGNGVYLVAPKSELSATVMKRLKSYSEILDTRFDIDQTGRNLN